MLIWTVIRAVARVFAVVPIVLVVIPIVVYEVGAIANPTLGSHGQDFVVCSQIAVADVNGIFLPEANIDFVISARIGFEYFGKVDVVTVPLVEIEAAGLSQIHVFAKYLTTYMAQTVTIIIIIVVFVVVF